MRTIANGYFFEGPRWHDGRFYVSDFFANTVSAYTLDGDAELIATVPQRPSGLGFMPNGDLLIASMRDRKLLRVHDGAVAEHADLSAIATGDVNDMLVDARGGAYVGNFGFDLGVEPARDACLAYVDPAGTARVVADDLWFPNGMALLPDGMTLLVAETIGKRISSFAVAPDGTLSRRAVWAAFEGSAAIRPDGIALAPDGRLWVADAGGSRAVLVAEGGRVVRTVAVEDGVFAVALGGKAESTLLLCAAPTYDAATAASSPRARLLTVPL